MFCPKFIMINFKDHLTGYRRQGVDYLGENVPQIQKLVALDDLHNLKFIKGHDLGRILRLGYEAVAPSLIPHVRKNLMERGIGKKHDFLFCSSKNKGKEDGSYTVIMGFYRKKLQISLEVFSSDKINMQTVKMFDKKIEYDPSKVYGGISSDQQFGLIDPELLLPKLKSGNEKAIVSFLDGYVSNVERQLTSSTTMNCLTKSPILLGNGSPEEKIISIENTLELFNNIKETLNS